MVLKPTPRARRQKKYRAYGTIWAQVRRGEIQISQELMQSITSPKWKAKIAEAAIHCKILGPSKEFYMTGRRGFTQITKEQLK